jgi:hypothetical protein
MKLAREQRNNGDIDDNHGDVRCIKFQSTPDQPGRSRSGAPLDHYSSEHQCRCVTGYENEQVGRIAKTVIPGRKRTQHLVRDVIEKDRPIRQAAN